MEDQGIDPQLIAAIVGGVIGIAGSILTLVASHFLRVSGKITVNVTDSSFSLIKSDKVGGVEDTTILADAESMEVRLGVDLYNSSELPRSLRELRVEIISRKGKQKLSLHPSVRNEFPNLTGRGGYGNPLKRLDLVNLPPKELTHLDLHCSARTKQLTDLQRENVVFLKALYPNGRKFQVRLLRVYLSWTKE